MSFTIRKYFNLASVFYRLIKLYARLTIRIYCRQIRINRPSMLQQEGPILLAANHPNSFLDGILLTTLFDHDIHSLARGDAFKNKHADRFLRWLRLLPVYRTSEGVENLGHNYTTFAACHKTFQQKGIVLIFSEGRCENEWHFRPLKKGTARLAITAWHNGVALRVIPVAFNYSSFKKFGKTVHIDFGDTITQNNIDRGDIVSKQLLGFNEQLQQQLATRIYEIPEEDKPSVRQYFKRAKSSFFYGLLFLPALLGWLLHAPLFYPIKGFTHFKFRHSGHYDSVLHALLMLLYPLYLLLFFFIVFSYIGWYALAAFIILPSMAWAWVQWSEVLE